MAKAGLVDAADRVATALAEASVEQLALTGLLVAALGVLCYALLDAWRYSRIPSIHVPLKPGMTAGDCWRLYTKAQA